MSTFVIPFLLANVVCIVRGLRPEIYHQSSSSKPPEVYLQSTTSLVRFPNQLAFSSQAGTLSSTSQPSTPVCKRSQNAPEVTVADSDHLLVDWTNAFENCESEKVKSALVEYKTFRNFIGNKFSVNVNFADKRAKVEANPCLNHSDFLVKTKYEAFVGFGYDDVWICLQQKLNVFLHINFTENTVLILL